MYEAPLEFINVLMTDSSTLTMCIKDCLVRFCLSNNQCRGQVCDGATNMLGHINGVAAQIQKEQPLAIPYSPKNRPTLENKSTPLLNEVVAKGAFLLKVRPPTGTCGYVTQEAQKKQHCARGGTNQ